MKTTNSALDNLDLSTYRQEKGKIEQAASQAIAEKIEQIEQLLNDIRQIGELTGVQVDMHGLKDIYNEIDDVGHALDEDWYSSSYSC